jgi:hypothetical protein
MLGPGPCAGEGVIKFPVESEIAKPPDEAFDAMADATNETRWNSKVTKSERVGDGPIGQGATLKPAIRKDLARQSASFARCCESR